MGSPKIRPVAIVRLGLASNIVLQDVAEAGNRSRVLTMEEAVIPPGSMADC